MIVVADTSVILNLCFLRLAASDPRFIGLAYPSFIQHRVPANITHTWAKSPRLHSGEIAALSLALELKADLVLMDEAAGRAIAFALKLERLGLLGILVEARKRALIPALPALMDRLQHEAHFWISPNLRACGEDL